MSVDDTPEPREAGWRALPPLEADGLPLVWASPLLQSYDLLLWATDVHEAAGDRFAPRGRPELALAAWGRAAAIRAELCLADRAAVSQPGRDG